MLSTRRQKAKARRSSEMVLMSNFVNMDVVLDDESSEPIERELAHNINGSVCHNDMTLRPSLKLGNIHHRRTRLYIYIIGYEYPRHERHMELWKSFQTK